MDIYLDEIPFPKYDPDDTQAEKDSHYYYGQWGDKLLNHDVRKSLIKRIRERSPSYRKERREFWEFWIKCGGIIIGIIGAITGFVAVYNKCGSSL